MQDTLFSRCIASQPSETRETLRSVFIDERIVNHPLDVAVGVLDEVTLVNRAQDGAVNAFEILVDRYQGPLFRHAHRLVSDRESAEDVVQDALISAWQRLPSLVRPEAFRGWMYQITTRRCLDLLRVRRPVLPWDEQTDERASTMSAIEQPIDPARVSEHQAQVRALSEVLAELPASERAIWAMREIDRLSYADIALAMSLPVSTVRGRIARVRLKILTRMAPWR